MSNPLLKPGTLPPFGDIRAEHMVPAVEQTLAEVRRGIEAIVETESCSYPSVVKAREELEDRLHHVWSPIGHLNGVMNSPEIREAHAKGLEC